MKKIKIWWNFCRDLIQSLYDRKSAKEILGFMIAGEVGILLKNVSPSPVRGFPHPHFNVSNTEIQSMRREKGEEQRRHYPDWILSYNHNMQMQMFCLAEHGFNIWENLFETAAQNES